jgi:hypothetical protein
MSERDMTIGALAAVGDVNVETGRCWQRCGLLPLPDKGARGTGSVRVCKVLEHLIGDCEQSAQRPTCPIIDSIFGTPVQFGPKRRN